MPKPLLNAALGVAMALCSSQALAGEGTFGVITGGGEGGDYSVEDQSSYYYIYLGAYYETPKFAGPLSWRFGALGLDYSGLWIQPIPAVRGYAAQILRLMTGPSFNVDLPGEWWLWDGLQAGLDFENTGSGRLPLAIQNELMFGWGFFSSYWKLDLRVHLDGGFEMRYLAGQIFFRLIQWLSLGPELRFQTSVPSVGLMAQVGDNRPRQRWNVTAGGTFDQKVGAQWHLDLWFSL